MCRLWGRRELDTTEATLQQQFSSLLDSVGQKGQRKDKCVKREGDGSCAVVDWTRRSS